MNTGRSRGTYILTCALSRRSRTRLYLVLVTIKGVALDNLTRPETSIDQNSLKLYVEYKRCWCYLQRALVTISLTSLRRAALQFVRSPPFTALRLRMDPRMLRPGARIPASPLRGTAPAVANGAHIITISADDSDPGGAHTATPSTTVRVANFAVATDTVEPQDSSRFV